MIHSELIIPIASVIISITALTLLLVQDWRISLIVLALQYLCVFVLILPIWPLPMAAAKLISGWIVAAVLGMAFLANPDLRSQLRAGDRQLNPATEKAQFQATDGLGFAFRVLTAGLVALTIASQLELVASWLPKITPVYAWASLLLIGFGMTKLGFTVQPFHILLALLTVLSGFEILYAVLEPSAISAGLFAAVTLAISLIGAYLLTAPYMEEET